MKTISEVKKTLRFYPQLNRNRLTRRNVLHKMSFLYNPATSVFSRRSLYGLLIITTRRTMRNPHGIVRKLSRRVDVLLKIITIGFPTYGMNRTIANDVETTGFPSRAWVCFNPKREHDIGITATVRDKRYFDSPSVEFDATAGFVTRTVFGTQIVARTVLTTHGVCYV